MWVEEVGLIEQDLTQHMDLDWRVQKDSIHGSTCRAGAAEGCPARPEATQYVLGFSPSSIRMLYPGGFYT